MLFVIITNFTNSSILQLSLLRCKHFHCVLSFRSAGEVRARSVPFKPETSRWVGGKLFNYRGPNDTRELQQQPAKFLICRILLTVFCFGFFSPSASFAGIDFDGSLTKRASQFNDETLESFLFFFLLFHKKKVKTTLGNEKRSETQWLKNGGIFRKPQCNHG